MRFFKHPLWARLAKVAWPFFVSEPRAKALGTLVILVARLFGVNGLNILISYVMLDFMTTFAAVTNRLGTIGEATKPAWEAGAAEAPAKQPV